MMETIDVYLVECMKKDGKTYPHSIYLSKEHAVSVVRLLARDYEDTGYLIYPMRLAYDAQELMDSAYSGEVMYARDDGYALDDGWRPE